jgi:hypothetical protein
VVHRFELSGGDMAPRTEHRQTANGAVGDSDRIG